MLRSSLFASDSLLQDIADDVGGVRISTHENAAAPSVLKVQEALLIRDPGCLPVSGADGVFGEESAAAVHRFKIDELDVNESQVVDDVGPLTVQRLDEIALAAEASSVALFNQFGDVLADVDVSVDDDGTVRQSTTDALGIAKLSLTSGGPLTVDPITLAIALGDLLDRPVIPSDSSDPGDGAVIVPQTRIAVTVTPRTHVNVAIVARIDLRVVLQTTLSGTLRIVGSGMKVLLEGDQVRVALQVNDGSAAQAMLDATPPTAMPAPVPAIPGWVLPNGYIVQGGDTADSLSQRFVGAPGLYSTLSSHDPVVGETLMLPPGALPGWLAIATQALPAPTSQTWFTMTPNDVITVLYSADGDMAGIQNDLQAIASPPDLALDPEAATLTNAEAISAFLTLPRELVAADTPATPTSPEGAGLDELVG